MSESFDRELRLAQVRARAEDTSDGEGKTGAQVQELAPFVLMSLCGHWYAADALQVQKVVAKGKITRVPGRSSHILGLSLVHDSLIPVVDLVSLAGATGAPSQLLIEPRLVVLGSSENVVGVIADEAHGIVELPREIHGPAEGVIAGETFWRDRQVSYVDIAKLVEASNDERKRG